jgi:hypothetical protein
MGNAFLPVKDPFHLPRALIQLIELFETRISAGQAPPANASVR